MLNSFTLLTKILAFHRVYTRITIKTAGYNDHLTRHVIPIEEFGKMKKFFQIV